MINKKRNKKDDNNIVNDENENQEDIDVVNRMHYCGCNITKIPSSKSVENQDIENSQH